MTEDRRLDPIFHAFRIGCACAPVSCDVFARCTCSMRGGITRMEGLHVPCVNVSRSRTPECEVHAVHGFALPCIRGGLERSPGNVPRSQCAARTVGPATGLRLAKSPRTTSPEHTTFRDVVGGGLARSARPVVYHKKDGCLFVRFDACASNTDTVSEYPTPVNSRRTSSSEFEFY